MLELETGSGMKAKFCTEADELQAGQYFVLEALISVNNAVDQDKCINNIAYHLGQENYVYASQELLLLNQSLHYKRNDIDLATTVLATLESTKPVRTVSEAIEKGKFLRELKISSEKAIDIAENVKKK